MLLFFINMVKWGNTMKTRKTGFIKKAGLSTLAMIILGLASGCKDKDNTAAVNPEENWPVVSNSTILELEETLKDHFGTLTKDDYSNILQEFKMQEPDGNGGQADVNCSQTLDFGNITPKLTKDDAGNVAVFLHAAHSEPVYTWRLTFADGLTSSVDADGNMTDLIQKNLFMCGKRYRITKATTTWNGGDVDEVNLGLMTGEVIMPLCDIAPTQTFTFDGKSYEVTYAGSRTAADGVIEANVIVNNQNLGWMKPGDAVQLADGSYAGVFDTESDMAEIGVGVKKVNIKDDNVNDTAFAEADNDSKDRVKAKVDPNAGTITLNELAYQLMPTNAQQQDIFVKKGETLVDKLENKDAAIVDVTFDGLETPFNKSDINFTYTSTATDSSYTFSFTNKEGSTYTNVPLVHNDGNSLKLGDADGNLIFTESSSETEYHVNIGDTVILSKDGDTFAFKYTSFQEDTDIGGYDIGITDYSGTVEEIIAVDSATASIKRGDHTFLAYVDMTTGKLAIDLNGDGKVDGSSVDVVDKYGARISVPTTGTDSITARIHTEASRLDYNQPENIDIEFEREDAAIDVNLNKHTYEKASGDEVGQTRYGVLATEKTNGDLSLQYPELQRKALAALKVD